MKVLNFELQKRTGADWEKTIFIPISIGFPRFFAIVVYDSIKRNFKWCNHWFYALKYGRQRIMKYMTIDDLVRAFIGVMKLEGKKDRDLVFARYQIGEATDEELEKYNKELEKKEKKKTT